jgi:hypothetical protein
MKKPSTTLHAPPPRLALRTELVRVLTARELALVAAGACLQGSGHSQITAAVAC